VADANYDAFDIDVTDGTLHVGRWNAGADRAVVAAHGLTGSHMNFEALADQLGDDYTVIAPDLRGRGRSNNITGPFGMAAHADDVRAALDHAGVEKATMIGHSMGGFVAVVTADRHPDRVRDLVLVDGGIPLDLPLPTDTPIEDVVRAVVGPALDRLRMTFESVEAYFDYWRPHPALADDWNDYVEHTYAYDLEGTAPQLRSSAVEAAVLEDSASELRSGDVERALENLRHRAVHVRAERGIFNQVPPLYAEPVSRDGIDDALVADVNHYTILLSERGAKAVADVIRSRA
jgi:pimeloyl-ACP methyl ester carboxylesterase